MIGPEISVPDVTEAVIGYRQFQLTKTSQHNYQLMSPHMQTPWVAQEQTAKCDRLPKIPEGIILPTLPKPHKAPHKGCSCGIYVYFDPCPVGDKDLYEDVFSRRYARHLNPPKGAEVQALMSLSGTIEVHARGMRAERARICGLGYNGQLTDDEHAALREIAKQWGVAWTHEKELPSLAPEFGRSLPESMKPEKKVEEPAREIIKYTPSDPSPTSRVARTSFPDPFAVPVRPSRKQRFLKRVEVYGVPAGAGAGIGEAALFAINGNPAAAVMMAAAFSISAWAFGRRSGGRS